MFVEQMDTRGWLVWWGRWSLCRMDRLLSVRADLQVSCSGFHPHFLCQLPFNTAPLADSLGRHSPASLQLHRFLRRLFHLITPVSSYDSSLQLRKLLSLLGAWLLKDHNVSPLCSLWESWASVPIICITTERVGISFIVDFPNVEAGGYKTSSWFSTWCWREKQHLILSLSSILF